MSFLENTQSAAMHVLRVLKDEDPGASLLIYWYYWNATVTEMLEVLRFYKRRVVFGFAPVIIFFLNCVILWETILTFLDLNILS